MSAAVNTISYTVQYIRPFLYRNGKSSEMRWWSSRENVLVLTHVEMKIRRHHQYTINGYHPTGDDSKSDGNETGDEDTNAEGDDQGGEDDKDYVRCEELYGIEDELAPDVEELDFYS